MRCSPPDALLCRPCALPRQCDYEAANFDVKKAKGYWQLGRLGPEESQELQAKVCPQAVSALQALFVLL
jgi:hypothetical protein